MAKTWLSIKVELLGGRGEELWPFPGRIFAVGPSHTFADLADAINMAFARWDHNHLNEFTFANGTVVMDPRSALDTLEAGAGPIMRPLNIHSTKVLKTAQLGEEFQFVFDLGDYWVHRCTVETEKIDPVTTVGIRPKTPTPYWGWGQIPDQYGRRWSSDDRESAVPRKPNAPDAMLSHAWPDFPVLTDAALEKAREAIAQGDPNALFDSLVGYMIDEHLSELAAASPLLLHTRTDQFEAIVLSFINRLSWRDSPGDSELADSLLERLRGS